ncbi:MAG: transglycosylase SLT domain-containing protein, partial [Gammaproteobacteria bacterium]|nr:transglycosylase SLT domain-containing protein [Gammaproteobacteria bacterium]
MLNISNQKIVILSLSIALLSACNSLITVKEKTSKPVSSQTTAKVEESTWQEAYGEPLAEQENILSEVPETEVEAESITPAPNPDLWQRIRDGFAISQPNLHADTQRQLQWFVNHPDYINRVVERARPYLHYIVDEIERRDMPLEIALLPVVESGFQPFAYSHGRAAGIWQFIPGTGRLYGLKQNWWYDGRRDIIESTRAALDYLQKLHNDFDDWQLALAAYNCGEGTVGRAIRRNKKAGKGIDFWSLDLPKETSAYVPKLMAVSELIKHPEKYELTLSSIDNSPFLTVVDVGGQIDLALAAKLAEISVDEMYQLNPGFNHWATTPDGPHRLVIP